MDAPYPTYLQDGKPYPYPRAGPTGHIEDPRTQAEHHRPQAGYSWNQDSNSGPQAGSYSPPAGWASSNPAGLPFQNQSGQPTGHASTPWMPAPPPLLNCPPGLEYLTQIDQILVDQEVELVEVLTGFETNNKYEIKNSLGQRVYFAVEDTDCCTRNCCGPSRPFTLKILDNLGQEVMILERPLRCSSCCFPCCLQEIEIQAPPGVPVGYVTQTWHPCLPKFTLQNERREDVLKVVGPCVRCICCTDLNFEVKSLNDEAIVGKISKHWSGCVKETFTDADNFGIQFPLDLDVKMKAVMLGACFLIEYMFFEDCN